MMAYHTAVLYTKRAQWCNNSPVSTDQVPYTAESIRAAVDADRERLFAAYSANRPPNWNCDQRTKDLVAIGNWIDGEHRRLGIDDLGRTTQDGRFNRESRSRDDLWTLAAEIMNDTLIDKIDRFRRPHRRWG
jgi:hypothetical protein